MLRHLLLIVALFGAIPPANAETLDASGVKFEPTALVGGSALLLNGAGTRHKLVVKVYVAGLYLRGKASTAEAALAMPGAKRIRLVMLRPIDANELGRLFTRAMQDNSVTSEFSKSIPGTIRMGEIFAARKQLPAGASVCLDWVPGVGTVILFDGKLDGGEPIKEPEFYQALMKIWLGKRPVDHLLKAEMLGQSASN